LRAKSATSTVPPSSRAMEAKGCAEGQGVGAAVGAGSDKGVPVQYKRRTKTSHCEAL
jgi:hypothetical protein